ncbi:hypothetical protein [Streptomyces sp. NPDC018584]|uniref:hypothetical protein n=1 Tax=unclassified Streptomyces TaxID=2593676 RepID=UPI0037B04DAD
MAIQHLVPAETEPTDLISYEEAEALFKDTPYPVSERTVKRWVGRHRLHIKRRGRTPYVSFSELLQIHRDMAARAVGESLP